MSSFILNQFKVVSATPSIPDYSAEVLQKMPCGLHRAKFNDAFSMLPELQDIFMSAPMQVMNNILDWEIDVKIHMLMKDQYPCIPNWHCDNVPRDADGRLQYQNIDYCDSPKMFLWVSDEPTTQFIAHDLTMSGPPKSHGEVSKIIQLADAPLINIPAKTWIRFDQNTPHCGRAATRNGWRIFVRLTHKSILSERPVISVLRRHAQVYCDARVFEW